MKLIATLLVLAVLAFSSVPVYAEDAKPTRVFSFTIVSEKERYGSEEPIWVGAEIRNISPGALALPKYILWAENILTAPGTKPQIVTSDGPPTVVDGKPVQKAEDFEVLQPGQTRIWQFDLRKNQFFNFHSGLWTFRIVHSYFSIKKIHPLGWSGTLESNEVRFQIGD